MKLYIPDICLRDIDDSKLDKYCISNDDIVEMYSSDGIYSSKNGAAFKKLLLIDGDVKCIKNYVDDMSLLIDESYVFKNKEPASRLPTTHHIKNIQHREFKMSEKSPVTLVLEKVNHRVNNFYFMLTQKHGQYSIPDIKNQFTQETIESFVNLIE